MVLLVLVVVSVTNRRVAEKCGVDWVARDARING
jgi:hypothetical protein